jgi:SAM-dependent methyltransferase
VVTGHYARVEQDEATGRWLLKKGLDENKDQSYVLYNLTQEQLAHVRLPLGGLHIAPEVCLMRKLRKHYDGHPGLYLTADLESPLADMHFDVQHIPLEDDFTDVVICNHILEHVEDDRQALRELHRILKPGGWGIVLSPMDSSRKETFEDDTITDPAERTRVFGQYDHRRIYGRDYADRLRSAGFEVADIDFAASLTEAERRLYALPDDHIYVVYKVRE